MPLQTLSAKVLGRPRDTPFSLCSPSGHRSIRLGAYPQDR